MKILIIGDLHFRSENISEIEIITEKIEKILRENNFDFSVILGDVLHTHERINTLALNNAYKFIRIIKKYTKVFVLVGNHDMISNQQFLTENHWMNGMKEWENVVVVDKVLRFENFIFSPFIPTGKFIEALNTIDNWDDARIIFAHQEFKGCKINTYIESQNGDSWRKDFPIIISGHIHTKQKIGENIIYVGSVMQTNFGENEEKSINILEVDEKEFKFTEIDLNLPKLKTLDICIDDINNISVKKNNEDKLRIIISGSLEEFKTFKKSEKYKKLVKEGVKIIFKHKDEFEIKPFGEQNKSFLDVLKQQLVSEQTKIQPIVYKKLLELYKNIFYE